MSSKKKPSSSAARTSGTLAKPREVTVPAAEPLFAESTGGSLDEIAAQLRDREAESSPVRRAAQAKHEQVTLESATTVTAESAVRAIGGLKVTVDSTLDQLSQ
jgi:hypothetical protein